MTGVSWGMRCNTFQEEGFDNSSQTSQRNVIFKFVKKMPDSFTFKECFPTPVTALGIVMLHFRNWKSMSDVHIHPRNERFPK